MSVVVPLPCAGNLDRWRAHSLIAHRVSWGLRSDFAGEGIRLSPKQEVAWGRDRDGWGRSHSSQSVSTNGRQKSKKLGIKCDGKTTEDCLHSLHAKHNVDYPQKAHLGLPRNMHTITKPCPAHTPNVTTGPACGLPCRIYSRYLGSYFGFQILLR
jgi:hypothetical protein